MMAALFEKEDLMKIKVQYAGGVEVTVHASELPRIGEPYDGEIVDKVTVYEAPGAGCDAMIVLKRQPRGESS